MDLNVKDVVARVSKLIEEHALGTSQRIIDAGVDKVYGSLTKSYQSGLGIKEAAGELKGSLSTYSDSSLQRVARTEINGAQNASAHASLLEANIDYEQWLTAGDDRVRGNDPDDIADHTALEGQITRIGEKFSNGLEFPGDRSGPIEEWINCRCTTVPYLMPFGKKAPTGKDQFYEYDLVDVEKGGL